MATNNTTAMNEEPEPRRDATVWEMAVIIAESRDFPECRSPQKAAVRIMAGREMGIGPIASVLGIRIQAGRVSMDAALMAGAVKRSGRYDYRVNEHTDAACCLLFTENGEAAGESRFTMDDATKAGLAKKDTWRAYPRNMLFARALSNGARWYCPAIFGGAVYSHEELGFQVDEDGRAAGGEGAETASGPANGDLCTREQRQEIAGLVSELGQPLAELLTELGVRMLDELSGYEAKVLIRKLTRKLGNKKAAGGGCGSTSSPGQAPATSAAPVAPTPAPPAELTPAQAMLADAMAESAAPSTPDQKQRILDLAERLVPDEDERLAMLKAALAKRSRAKLAELTHLQAAELIAGMEARLADEPPFEADKAGSPKD